MPLAVLFLLLGTLAAEIALFGIWIAAPVGAGLLGLAALSLAVVGLSRRRARGRSELAIRTQRTLVPVTRAAHRPVTEPRRTAA